MIKLYEGCWGVTRAGEKPTEAPKFPEVGSSFDFRRQDGTWINVCVVPDATSVPQPVTWPDGVTEIHLEGGDNVSVNSDGWIGINDRTVSFRPESARQLAALLKAAADYVDGGGK